MLRCDHCIFEFFNILLNNAYPTENTYENTDC